MELPPNLLPGFGLSCPERLALLAAVSHVAIGLSYLALTGISATWSRGWRHEIGTGWAATGLAAAVWALTVLLWPVPLVCRTARSLRSRQRRPAAGELRWRYPARPAASQPEFPAVPVWPRPGEPQIPPHWYRDEYEAVRVTLAEGRTVIARTWASGLVDDAVIEFGTDHPYTRYAWELLAHVVRTALAETSTADSAPDAKPSDDPFRALLFPQGHRTAYFDADRASVYVTTARDLPPAVTQ